MMSLSSLKAHWFNPLLILIITGPLIDILSLIFKDGSFSVSALARIIVLFVLLLIFISSPSSNAKTKSLYILVICLAFFVLQFLFVSHDTIMDLVYQDIRMWYFPLALALVMGSQSVRYESIPKVLLVSASIYAAVIIIAAVLGTSVHTYSAGDKGGAAGWFYAANEIGAILAMGAFLAVLYISEPNRILRGLSLAPVGILIAAPIINTKVALFGSIAALVVVLFYYYRKRKASQLSLYRIILCCLVFVSAYVVSPVVYGFSSRNASALSSESSADAVDTIRSDVFSGRLYFLEDRYSEFVDGTTSRILLGRGDYSDESKVRTAEMDPFDILFANGIVGFIVYLVAIWSFIHVALKRGKKKALIGIEAARAYVLRVCLVFMLVLSLVAGHIMVAPAVSVFIVGIIYYLTALHAKQRKESA